MKITKLFLYIAVAIVLISHSPAKIYAMNIFVEQPATPAEVGGTVLLKVFANTNKIEINAIEGSLIFNNPADIVSINTGGSILSLWPKKPSLVGNKIYFAGGTPSGFYGTSLNIFTIAVKPTSLKPIKITFDDVSVYSNDGRGTRTAISGQTTEILVQQTGKQNNELTTLLAADKKSPEAFHIELGKDPRLFNGKYFISFFATDNDSGIDRFEIKEKGYPVVRSESPYVLQNQELTGSVSVVAIDNAGNTRTETLSLGASGFNKWWLMFIVLIGVVFTICLRFIKK